MSRRYLWMIPQNMSLWAIFPEGGDKIFNRRLNNQNEGRKIRLCTRYRVFRNQERHNQNRDRSTTQTTLLIAASFRT